MGTFSKVAAMSVMSGKSLAVGEGGVLTTGLPQPPTTITPPPVTNHRRPPADSAQVRDRPR